MSKSITTAVAAADARRLPAAGPSSDPGAPQPPRRPADVAASLLRAIQRLEDIIEEETSALEQRGPVDLDESSRRKNRGLLELVRVSRAAEDLGGDMHLAQRLDRLRTKLERNRAVLQMHLEAVREVSAVIAKAIRDAESDGTYTPSAQGQGK